MHFFLHIPEKSRTFARFLYVKESGRYQNR